MAVGLVASAGGGSGASAAWVAPPAGGGHALFRWINGHPTPLGDAVFGQLSGLGDGLVAALVCTVLLLARPRAGAAGLAAFAVSGLLAQALKRLFDAPRPPAVLDHVHVLGQALTAHSFPSGHATTSGAMLTLALLAWPRAWAAWLAAAAYLLAAVGRVYGGVHWPLDVAAGLLLGAATMLVVWRASATWPVARWAASPWWARVAGLGALVQAGVLGLGYRIQPSTARPLAVAMALLAALFVWRCWRRWDGCQGMV